MKLAPSQNDDGTDGFCFTWTIHNFPYCLQKTSEELESPSFTKDLLKTSTWSLVLYPRGEFNSDCIAFYLKIDSTDGVKKINYALSIKLVNGSFKKLKDSLNTFKSVNQRYGFQKFIDIDEVYKKGDGAYLENDSLTVRCRIWGNDEEQCHAQVQTFIGIEKITRRNLALSNATTAYRNKIQTIAVQSNWFETLVINIFQSQGYFAGRKLRWEIKKNTESVYNYITCHLTMFQNKRNVYSLKDDHWFEASHLPQIWSLPFFIENNLLKASDLFWNIDFVMSRGVVSSSEITRINFIEDTQEIYSKPKICLNCPMPLSPILQDVYTDGKFNDFTIRTPNKDFTVHKAILCNRSEVFSAMFEHDMEENRTGVVKIEDLDEDTVSKMLLFIYSNIVNDLDVETASKLYFAADKYKITDLKSKCSVFFIDNLNALTVCRILVLADMHQDESLKLSAQEFIMNEAVDILNSKEWKRLIRDNSRLAAETLNLLCMKNLKV